MEASDDEVSTEHSTWFIRFSDLHASNFPLISLFKYSQSSNLKMPEISLKKGCYQIPLKNSLQNHIQKTRQSLQKVHCFNIVKRLRSDTNTAVDHVWWVELFLFYTDVPAPYDISVQSIGTDFARLGWKCLDSISTFELRCSSCTSSSIQTVSQNYAEVSGLCPGTEYTFTVVAVSENGKQSSSAKVSAYTGNKQSMFL